MTSTPSPSLSDPQQHAVYAMENEELVGHTWHVMRVSELRKWTREQCALVSLPAPKIIVRRLGGYDGMYEPSTDTIYLDTKNGKNGLTLAHELAHYITYRLHPRATDHGPTWLLYYAKLLDHMRLVPEAGVRAIARRHKVCMRSAAPT